MRILFALCLVVGWTGTILAAENDAARCRHYRTDEPANDPESQWKFGKGEYWTCHDCQRVESCLPRVLSRLKSAAERDYLPAAEELRIIYGLAPRLPHSISNQRRWGLRAAELGGAEQAYRYALILLPPSSEPRVDEALKWLSTAADKGSTDAMYELATIYSVGKVVPVDDAKANDRYRQLAHAGSSTGMIMLGMNIQAGYGTPSDPPEAVDWYRKAFDAGSEQAAYLLGLAYERGVGVKRDEREAIKWYQRVTRTIRKCPAQFRVGRIYEKGRGVRRDVARALRHYDTAQRADPFECWLFYEHLSFLYTDGEIVGKDLLKAGEHRRKAEHLKRTASANRYGVILGLDNE
jgi:TPR repeat protein